MLAPVRDALVKLLEADLESEQAAEGKRRLTGKQLYRMAEAQAWDQKAASVAAKNLHRMRSRKRHVERRANESNKILEDLADRQRQLQAQEEGTSIVEKTVQRLLRQRADWGKKSGELTKQEKDVLKLKVRRIGQLVEEKAQDQYK